MYTRINNTSFFFFTSGSSLGQKFPTPTPGFGDRVFYETLLRQRPDSAMAQEWYVSWFSFLVCVGMCALVFHALYFNLLTHKNK